jgi:hypothetical protein
VYLPDPDQFTAITPSATSIGVSATGSMTVTFTTGPPSRSALRRGA